MTNILFVGNSFTYVNELPKMLQAVATYAGEDIFAESVVRGGAYLHEFADPEHELGQKLNEMYHSRKWDYIVLQDQSFNPARNPEDFLTSAERLCHMMNNGEKILFYGTWAYRDNTEKLSSTGMTYTKMLDALTASYQKAADIQNGILVPVGDAFALSTEKYPEIDLYAADDYHPSVCGTYLAMCLFYKAIFKKIPESSMIHAEMTVEQGKALREIAMQF